MIPSLSVLANRSAPAPPPPPPPPPPGGGPAASIVARTVNKIGLNNAAATATYQLNSNGNVYNHAGTYLEAWLDSGVNTEFQSRATLSSGDPLSAGTLGTWQALSTTREWSQHAAAGGFDDYSSNVLIEIRMSASPFTVLTSATITISASSTGNL